MDARRLKKLRLRLGLSQQQLADELGMSQAMVSMMEKGRYRVLPRTVMQLTAIRREHIRQAHYLKASQITGRSVSELGGDVGLEGDEGEEGEEGEEEL